MSLDDKGRASASMGKPAGARTSDLSGEKMASLCPRPKKRQATNNKRSRNGDTISTRLGAQAHLQALLRALQERQTSQAAGVAAAVS